MMEMGELDWSANEGERKWEKIIAEDRKRVRDMGLVCLLNGEIFNNERTKGYTWHLLLFLFVVKIASNIFFHIFPRSFNCLNC